MKRNRVLAFACAGALALALCPLAFADEDAPVAAADAAAQEEAAEAAEAPAAEPEEGADAALLAEDDAAAAEGEATDAAAAADEPATDASAADEPAPAARTFEGWYRIRAVGANKYLDVSGSSRSKGANIQIWNGNDAMAQLVRFVDDGDGWYRIVIALQPYALDVAGASKKPGANVQTWETWKGNAAQEWRIQGNPDGTVTFLNRGNGLALDIAGGSTKAGANVQVYTPNGTAAQKFAIEPAADLMPTGIYTLRPMYANRVLDVSNGSAAEGANVQLWTSKGVLAQKFSVEKQGDGTYSFRSLASGKYLAQAADGGNVQQRGALDGYALWRPYVNSGTYMLQNVATGAFLDVTRAGNADGSNVSTYARNNSKAQRFYLNGTAPLGNGTYYIQTASNAKLVADVSRGGTANGTNVQVWSNLDNGKITGNGAQKWTITRNSDGTYKIRNAASLKALDVSNCQMRNGANVQIWAAGDDTLAQKWRITYVDGAFKIAAAANPAFVLDVADGRLAAGSNLQLWRSNGTDAQRFAFASTAYEPPMSPTQRNMYNIAQGISSPTGWLIVVDTNDPYLGVFRGSKGNWEMVKFWQASCGAPSTPTVKGLFSTGIKGLVFGHGYSCWWYTQFYGDYLIHSLIYHEGSMTHELEGANTLGVNRSQGCVRVLIDQAKWIYDTIPTNTSVYIY